MNAADFINRIVETNPQSITDSSLAQLHEALFDRSAAVRLAIAQALGKLAKAESASHLKRPIDVEGESKMVKTTAVESLNRCVQS